jgi:tetratricopeptide (TPR) repeat protein
MLLADYTAALADAKRALEESPGSVDPHLAQVRLLSIQGKYDAALAEAQAALDVAADYNRADCLVARAYIYVRLNRLDEATAEFEKLIEPKTSDDLFKPASISDLGLLGLSELAIARKSYDEALTVLDRWANNGPNTGWGYVLRAQVYIAQNQPDKARADLEHARTLILFPDEVAVAERLQQQLGGS